MKKAFVLITIFASALMINAQEAAELKNAGNAALKTKDYKTALEKYEAYMATEEGAEDKATIYNSATCAKNLDNTEKAFTYYNKAIDLNYKADYATFYIAQMLKKQDKEDEYLAKLAEGLSKYPNSRVKKYYLAGLTGHYNKLAATPYNKGNQLFAEAGASGDYATYISKTKKAMPLWDEAKELFNKTLEYDPTNSDAKTAIANIEGNIKMYKDYVASVKESQE